MNTSSQFPALMGKDALPGLKQAPKTNGGKLSHPLGKSTMKHPLKGKKG